MGSGKKSQNYSSSYSSFGDEDDYSSSNYDSLGEKFDQTIDEVNDNQTTERQEVEINFSKILQTANPRTVLTLTQPKILPAPLFVEYQNAAVFHLVAPESFDRENFEAAIERKILSQVTTAAPDVKLDWQTKSENPRVWRELRLPMIGWNVNYAIIGNELLVANDADFLRQILVKPNLSPLEKQNFPFDSLGYQFRRKKKRLRCGF